MDELGDVYPALPLALRDWRLQQRRLMSGKNVLPWSIPTSKRFHSFQGNQCLDVCWGVRDLETGLREVIVEDEYEANSLSLN